jgi:acetyltransferase
MHKLIDYHRSRGTQVLTADVLAENARMLALARDLGFSVEPGSEAGVRRVHLSL